MAEPPRSDGLSPAPSGLPVPRPTEVRIPIPVPPEVALAEGYASVEAFAYRGPFFPPAVYAEFETVVPGAAARLLALAEEQTRAAMEQQRAEVEHRHGSERMELLAVEADQQRLRAIEWNGQLFALIAVFAVVGVALAALFLGYPWAAGTIVAGLIGLASVFIFGRAVQLPNSDPLPTPPPSPPTPAPRPAPKPRGSPGKKKRGKK